MVDSSICERFLRIPLYKLFYIDELESYEGLTSDEKRQFLDDYSPDEQRSILDAIEWGLQQPDLDAGELLPGLQYPTTEVHKYLNLMHRDITDAIKQGRDASE